MRFVSIEKDLTDHILDIYIHRILRLGENLSADPSYSIIVDYSDGVHTLNVKGPHIAAGITCNNIQIPENLLVRILTSSNPLTQPTTTLDSGFQRVINTGVDISTQPDTHAMFVTDLKGQLVTDYLLVSTSSSIEKVKVGGAGWKIPPNTGDR
jgi:hypothetical protein